MSGWKATGAGKARQGKARVIHVSPLARAVQIAFAASLALAGSGVAFAGTCTLPASGSVECTSVSTDSNARQDVPDLTQVSGPEGVPTSVTTGAFGVDVVSSGPGLTSFADITNGSAVGATAFSVDIVNSGPITRSGNGDVIGIDADFAGADISIVNRASGVIDVESADGLADGIFANGDSVSVKNQGAIEADGFDWAAGIEAQGYDLTTVTNSGDISATATANDETNAIYGSAFGIYATGGEGGVKVNNKGTITADGVFATGVQAQGGGPITVSNTGDITIGGSEALTSYYSTGIQASSNYADSAIKVNNRGTIAATGDFGAKGIAATATGEGSAASVTNAGGVSAISEGSDYSNAAGIFASGDAGATVRNTVDGTIFASGNGYAYGVQALTFNGDANVVNNGDLTASADGNAKYSAYAVGVLASSLNGNATVSNTGSISANAASQASAVSRGIYATGVAADVVNSGTITTDGGNSLGIGAVGSTGDVTVLNQGSIHATGNKYSSGTGIAGVSTYGDVSLTNSSNGDIVALGSFGANGMQARSFYGDVDLVNAGSIEVGSSDPSTLNQPNAIGIYAGSRTGNVSVVNSGTILAQTASNATGIQAFTTGDGTTTVDNSGTIQAITKNVGVWGIYTGSNGGGDIGVHNSGTIEASTGAFHATGIWGYAGTYDYYGNGTLTGDISVVNDGTITASSRGDDATYSYGLINSRASGIWAYGMDTDVANTGSITADGFAGAGGIEAYSAGQTLVSNSGDISVSATANDATRRIYGQAFGIKASGGADGVSVANSGGIDATAPFTAIGIYAASADGDSSVNNDGAVSATSTYGLADGIFASGVNVDVTTGATSSITASGFNWAAGIEAQSYDLTTVSNGGDISAVATANDETYGIYGQAFGIYAGGAAGGINATNSGNITADGVFASGMFTQAGGPVTITTTGDITVGANPGLITYYGTGIHASSSYEESSVAVDNSGNLSVYGYFGSTGIEAAATGAGSTVSVTNSGNISMTGYAGTGILASGDGDTNITNGGSISSLQGDGAVALAFNGTASVTTSGDISAYVYGITASSQNGAGYVNNSGTVETSAAVQTFGIYASGATGTTVINTGSVTAGVASAVTQYSSKYSNGIFTHASLGDASVSNSGAVVTEGGKYGRGILAIASQGDVAMTNAAGGSIAVNQGKYAAQQVGTGVASLGYGIEGVSYQGDVSIDNAGSVTVASTRSFGLFGLSEAGNVSVSNSGTVDVYGFVKQIGVQAQAIGGNVTVDNSGTITASATGNYAFPENNKAFGIVAYASGGDINVSNEGTITAATGTGGIIDPATGYVIPAGDAFGISAASPDGNISVSNSGTVTATSNSGEATALDRYGNVAYAGDAIGIYANASGGNTSVSNDGTVSATSTFGAADGINAAGRNVNIVNRGDIAASTSGGNDAIGINGTVVGGDLTLANTASGSITATSVDGDAVGLQGTITDAGVTVTNAGSISVGSVNGTAYAIRIIDGSSALAPGAATLVNGGSITGAIVTGSGNDTMSNLRGGTWDVSGTASNFGAGNDSFTNAAGARLGLSDAGISFGAGNNRFTNAGTIHVSGNNTIDMTDGSASAVAAALARPKGTASFTNNGTIDMLDGAADDSLTITGSFGGSGAVNFDVSLLNKRNDQLFVQGGVLNGSKQRVNVVLLDGLPKSSDVGTKLELVHVSGDTNPSVFVGGDVLGISPRDFLSMGLKLSSKPDKGVNAGDGSAYMLSVKTYVKGLSASGVLASSAALGVDSLMTSGTGSWRDRQYALQAMGGKPAFASITPWVRGFNDEGGMSPDHLMASFGQMSSSRVSQDNSGTEVGMEFQGTHGLRFGTVFGKSEATQSLVNEYGRNTIRGNTMGLYATWLGQNGFYVDTSWRTMKFEAAIGSGGLYQRNNGNAYSANLEAGYAWTLDNGLNIEPKLQYTSTTIDGMQVQGDEATFRSEQARWNRGQAGFSFSKRYGGGSGWRLTPYGELSMLRTFDGVANYSINQDYFGDVMTEGTSALVKLGLGAQKGRFSWSGGVNWMDGAAYDSVFGGQMTVGYSW